MFRILLDNVDNYTYDLRVVSRPSVPVTNYEYDETDIKHRGKLYKASHIPDKVIKVDFNFVEHECFGNALRKMNAWFLNAKTLKFSDDVNVYFKIKKVEIDDIERELKILGKFTVQFTVEPYAYSCEGDEELTFFQDEWQNNGLIMYNFGTINSYPRFRLHGNGTLSINVNGKEMTVKNVVDYVDIDTELEYCFKGSTNMNKYMTGNFETFKTGENVMTFSSSVSQLDIIPRWRYL